MRYLNCPLNVLKLNKYNTIIVCYHYYNTWMISLEDLRGAQFHVLPQGPVWTCYATESSSFICLLFFTSHSVYPTTLHQFLFLFHSSCETVPNSISSKSQAVLIALAMTCCPGNRDALNKVEKLRLWLKRESSGHTEHEWLSGSETVVNKKGKFDSLDKFYPPWKIYFCPKVR